MAVRNFWVDADIDGRKTMLSGGPASKEGGMTIVVKQRKNGGIVTAFKVYCYEDNGQLVSEVIEGNGVLVCSCTTIR